MKYDRATSVRTDWLELHDAKIPLVKRIIILDITFNFNVNKKYNYR